MEAINLFTQTRTVQPPAPPREAVGKMTWAERFQVFHAEHPDVYRAFCEIVDRLWSKGHKRFGCQGVFWMIRAEYGVDREGRQFSLPNGFSPHYARKYLADHPEREGFFELRELKV